MDENDEASHDEAVWFRRKRSAQSSLFHSSPSLLLLRALPFVFVIIARN